MAPTPAPLDIVASVLFAIAVVHTFSTKFFERLARRYPAHSGIFHLLGEVEVVFGFWAMVLVLVMMALQGREAAVRYLDSRNYTEPLFVFAIMVVAGSRPVLQAVRLLLGGVVRLVPLGSGSFYFTVLFLTPLLGSFITEPAAMTLAALLLRDHLFARGVAGRVKYGTLGVLFVNVSIGGALTPFAAPPVLMVAATWGWDMGFMLGQFGWKVVLASAINALGATWLFRHSLAALGGARPERPAAAVPGPVMLVHGLFLAGLVVFAHHPSVFMGIFLFFLGFSHAYARYQGRLILREGLLVAFFLGGLVVLGGMQKWWLQPLLAGMDSTTVYYGTTALTAITDNAALTYLGSLVEGLSDEFKYSLVAGALTGGGLTVIANAPNPAGFSILREYFTDKAVHPLGLFLAATPPTLVTIAAFRLL